MLPILYSFRRCPFAIRARLALLVSETAYELREIQLRNKPIDMLTASPKGSVPILVLPDGQVIDESWDIMQWALQQHDPDNWLGQDGQQLKEASALVETNDSTFKTALDRYKYANRHPAHPPVYYRMEGEKFLQQLENRLENNAYLSGNHLSIADAAVIPFIRQFAGVDQDWFDQSAYPKLRNWSQALINSSLFSAVMLKHSVWRSGDMPIAIMSRNNART
ncbi:MAG: glutathione S-transferase [Sulfuriferula multivorans]|uniref:Glutathione S-transferase n=1 Tax=Sulfuriferula multivorans TaxID=1559896 RepID=A0A7C9P8T8_9PROT|nr:glutathione S-transferase [Sulfuriferula multivorans]